MLLMKILRFFGFILVLLASLTACQRSYDGPPQTDAPAPPPLKGAYVCGYGAVIFNGDGYSEVWHKEAVRRGLKDLRTTPDALVVLTDPEVILTHFASTLSVFESTRLSRKHLFTNSRGTGKYL